LGILNDDGMRSERQDILEDIYIVYEYLAPKRCRLKIGERNNMIG
jgi:hypothetical protein